MASCPFCSTSNTKAFLVSQPQSAGTFSPKKQMQHRDHVTVQSAQGEHREGAVPLAVFYSVCIAPFLRAFPLLFLRHRVARRRQVLAAVQAGHGSLQGLRCTTCSLCHARPHVVPRHQQPVVQLCPHHHAQRAVNSVRLAAAGHRGRAGAAALVRQVCTTEALARTACAHTAKANM